MQSAVFQGSGQQQQPFHVLYDHLVDAPQAQHRGQQDGSAAEVFALGDLPFFTGVPYPLLGRLFGLVGRRFAGHGDIHYSYRLQLLTRRSAVN